MEVATTLSVMTLGPQQTGGLTTLVQPAALSSSSCVIVTTQQQHLHNKTVELQQKRQIAPATSSTTSSEMLRCKRRIDFTPNTHLTYSGLPGHQPASVARRNARERNRVKQVNNGFATLRSHIPLSVAAALSAPVPPPTSRGASKKLSKVDTLRMAVEYIRSLQQILDEHESSTTSSTDAAALVATGSDTGYYSSSPESAVTQHYTMLQQQAALGGSSLSPPCSEASSSPTPSYASEHSGSAVSSYAPTSVYQQENYENYEPMSPEDEELLDVISWWQQSQ